METFELEMRCSRKQSKIEQKISNNRWIGKRERLPHTHTTATVHRTAQKVQIVNPLHISIDGRDLKGAREGGKTENTNTQGGTAG